MPPSIYSMVVGQETWEVGDSRQLTSRADGEVTDAEISPDGKTVVFKLEKEGKESFCLMKTSGGPIKAIMSTARGDVNSNDPEGGEWGIGYSTWSPDSRFIAIATSKYRYEITEPDSDGNASGQVHLQEYIQLFDSKGQHYSTFSLPAQASVICAFHFSPDSSRIAVLAGGNSNRSSGEEERLLKLYIFNTDGSNSVRSIDAERIEEIRGWMDSNSIACIKHTDYATSLVRVWLDDRAEEVLQPDLSWVHPYSPDFTKRIKTEGPGLTVEDLRTGKVVQASKTRYQFVQWTFDSTRLTHQQAMPVQDDSGSRKEPLWLLWLVNTESSKLNSMCLAVLSDYARPRFSRDCSRVVYTNRRRLCVTEIVKRSPTNQEKAIAGLPLTEEEMKELLMGYARRVEVALEQYMMDSGKEPLSIDDLADYGASGIFARPDTGELIFQFGGQTEDGEPLLGIYDAGYDWRIEIGYRGNVEIRSRQ